MSAALLAPDLKGKALHGVSDCENKMAADLMVRFFFLPLSSFVIFYIQERHRVDFMEQEIKVNIQLKYVGQIKKMFLYMFVSFKG